MAISQTIGAIGFPVLIIALVPLRWVLLPRVFTEFELKTLDAPTADAPVVMASMGGRPELPEVRMARDNRVNGSGNGEDGRCVDREAGDGEAGGSSSGISEESKEGEKHRRNLEEPVK